MTLLSKAGSLFTVSAERSPVSVSLPSLALISVRHSSESNSSFNAFAVSEPSELVSHVFPFHSHSPIHSPKGQICRVVCSRTVFPALRRYQLSYLVYTVLHKLLPHLCTLNYRILGYLGVNHTNLLILISEESASLTLYISLARTTAETSKRAMI